MDVISAHYTNQEYARIKSEACSTPRRPATFLNLPSPLCVGRSRSTWVS